MLKAEQIPPDAMYAAWKAMNAGMTLNDAIAAAINAWPGTAVNGGTPVWVSVPNIILPLPQENTND